MKRASQTNLGESARKPRMNSGAPMRRLPCACTSMICSRPCPSPHDTVILPPASVMMLPGSRASPESGSMQVVKILSCKGSLPPACSSVHAAGYGDSPRTRLCIRIGGIVQSMRHVSLNIFGAGVGCSSVMALCGSVRSVPSQMARMVRRVSLAQRCMRRS